MKLFAALALCAAALSAQDGGALFNEICAGCHNGSMRSPSGALLDRFDAEQISASPEVWSQAYRQLQAGTMQFFDGATLLGTSSVTSGQASFTVNSMNSGNHPITAVYSGNATLGGSTSPVLTQAIH